MTTKPENKWRLGATSANDLALILNDLRRVGKSIAFTNGVFDLIHPGHVESLRQARALADVLVVGINSDESVKRLKGPLRPLLKADERARILTSFHCVDYVVIFDEDTPARIIEAVEPDVLVKGGDYTPDTIVGRDFVEGRGGRVVVIPIVDGLSTTNIIDRILSAPR